MSARALLRNPTRRCASPASSRSRRWLDFNSAAIFVVNCLLHPRPIGLAKSLRRRATSAEAKLWAAIRQPRLHGLKFKRQFPLGTFVADFACPEHHLIVEVDGSQHGDAGARRRD